MKKENVLKNLICAVIAIGLMLLGVFCFRESYLRFFEACKDFGLAVAGVFLKAFSFSYDFNSKGVFEVSSIPLESIIPLDFSAFVSKVKNFGSKLIDVENIVGYFHVIWLGSYIFIYLLLIGVSVLFIVLAIIDANLKGKNNNHGAESKPLVLFKRFERRILSPINFEVKSFVSFVRESKLWKVIWTGIIVFNLNVATVLMELTALYFVLLDGLNVSNLYIIFYKLFADLSMLTRVPVTVWIIVAIFFVLIWRRKKGYERLNRREQKNRAVIELLCTFVIFFATMGAGKTLTMTDVILTKQQELRESALDIMKEVDLTFPDFKWAVFEQDMKNMMNSYQRPKRDFFGKVVRDEYGNIVLETARPILYNLSRIDDYFHNLKITAKRYFDEDNCEYRKFYDKAVAKGKLKPIMWGYDVEYYGFWADNALKYEYILDALRDYAQAYFIYSLPTSLIFSNYAVVTKDVKNDTGNFPAWMTDFFEVPTFESDGESMNSHILDNDMLRLGKKFDENNKYKDVFEFGVLAYTEGDKERGNMLDTMELKKLVEEVNQKNDNFNGTFKMSRHPATIRNRKFFFAYMDMQRTSSINADLKEIGDNVKIESATSTEMLMPFFAIDELVFNLVMPYFYNKYYEFRHNRGDMNLTMYLMKKVATAMNNHYVRAYNTFGCKTEKLIINEEKEAKYYIMPKKIFSGVFSSDALASFFRMKSSRATLGVNDIPTYQSDKASISELEQLNSYFVQDWMKYLGKDE